MGDLTEHFSRSEFACRCGCGTESMYSIVVQGCQLMREAIGEPLIVTSGRRCEDHNRAVGGSATSQHVLGAAADLAPTGETPLIDLYLAALRVEAFRLGGIGVYPGEGFVHVDVRPPPSARWGRLHRGEPYVGIDIALCAAADAARRNRA